MRKPLIIGAVVALAAVAVSASTTRLPDAFATSLAGAVNTPVGHWAVSGDGSLDTNPLGMVITFQ